MQGTTCRMLTHTNKACAIGPANDTLELCSRHSCLSSLRRRVWPSCKLECDYFEQTMCSAICIIGLDCACVHIFWFFAAFCPRCPSFCSRSRTRQFRIDRYSSLSRSMSRCLRLFNFSSLLSGFQCNACLPFLIVHGYSRMGIRVICSTTCRRMHRCQCKQRIIGIQRNQIMGRHHREGVIRARRR